MQLFNKLSNPVFLKEDSDLEEYIERLENLRDRATGELRERIELELKFASIGHYGEKNIAFELKNSGMPIYVLHDIHLEIDGLSAQIDYLVVTRKLTFIIECKNLIGNITVDSNGNFIREYYYGRRKVKEGIYSPITQVSRHLEVLRQKIRARRKSNFMKKMVDRYLHDNYKTVVVLANPKTILNDRYAKKDVKNKIIRADQLNEYIKKMHNESKNEISNDSELEKWAERLLSYHTPNKSDYAKKFEDLLKEVERENNEEKPLEAPKEEVVKALAPETDGLHEKLRAYRLEKSRGENTKAYYIFTNAELENLIEKLPRSKDELKEIYGFGKTKIDKYGDDIIDIING